MVTENLPSYFLLLSRLEASNSLFDYIPFIPQRLQQDSKQLELTQTEEPQLLPSLLIVAAIFSTTIAVFGTVLSLCLRKKGRNLT